MNKRGFTLAEVLVTLGIIGVVSALTIPTFTTKTNAAKIGPTLSKAVAVFEQASQQVLAETNSDSLTNAMVCQGGVTNCTSRSPITTGGGGGNNGVQFFWPNYSHYLKGAQNGDYFITSDGIKYTPGQLNVNASGQFPAATLLTDTSSANNYFEIDINGNAGPNKEAVDKFYFTLYNDGSLKPVGSYSWNGTAANSPSWNSTGGCEKNSVPGNPKLCAGHIFENNLKADYKF